MHQGASDASNLRPARTSAGRLAATADTGVRLVGAMLALAVAAVHVADQGGITSFAMPGWIGWSYRLVEVGGALTAVLLVMPRAARLGPAWLGWAVAVPLAAGPFAAYIVSRSVGLPGDAHDVGHWGYWVGTVSLLVEAALIVLGVCMVRAQPATAAAVDRRAGVSQTMAAAS